MSLSCFSLESYSSHILIWCSQAARGAVHHGKKGLFMRQDTLETLKKTDTNFLLRNALAKTEVSIHCTISPTQPEQLASVTLATEIITQAEKAA